MHGIWFLLVIPLAATLSWRLSGPVLRRVAAPVSILAAVALFGWFGYLTVIGAEFTETIFDRMMHASGVIISYVDVPLVQILSAAVLVVCWPTRWTWSGNQLRTQDVMAATVTDNAEQPV